MTVKADELQEVQTYQRADRARRPMRGRIFDGDGRILADNQRSCR